jgi:hypothetical protein
VNVRLGHVNDLDRQHLVLDLLVARKQLLLS